MKVSYTKALSLLKAGELVAIPTETVYGLAGRIDSEKAIQKIFQVKKRPAFDPLIVHCFDKASALSLGFKKSPLLEELLDHFTPGPLTLLIEKNKKVSDLITAEKKTVGLRLPQHPLTRRLLKDLKIPLAAPSANPYGKVSPVSANQVLSAFKNKVPVLDGGVCEKGLESTILQISPKKLFLLRPGMITKKELETFLYKKKLPYQISYKTEKFQPGGANFHYQPSVPFYMIETKKPKQDILEFLSKKEPHKKIQELKIFPSSQKTAKFIYSQLHEFSKDKKNLIYVQNTKLKQGGLWDTIRNRLEKASSAHFKF